MKREIKFRAWDEGHKEMHHNFQFIKSGDEGNDWIIFISDKQILKDGLEVHTHNPFFRQQFHIMQFTGLLDRNGKEIYEGDICDGRYGRFVVKFIDGGFFPLCGEINAPNKPEEREVIGNRFESPELINK